MGSLVYPVRAASTCKVITFTLKRIIAAQVVCQIDELRARGRHCDAAYVSAAISRESWKELCAERAEYIAKYVPRHRDTSSDLDAPWSVYDLRQMRLETQHRASKRCCSTDCCSGTNHKCGGDTPVDGPHFDREVSHDQSIDDGSAIHWHETRVSSCPYGCKIYTHELTGERVLAHNSTYGCYR